MLPAQQQQQYAPNAGVAYTCGECGHENVIKLGDVIRCCSCCYGMRHAKPGLLLPARPLHDWKKNCHVHQTHPVAACPIFFSQRNCCAGCAWSMVALPMASC